MKCLTRETLEANSLSIHRRTSLNSLCPTYNYHASGWGSKGLRTAAPQVMWRQNRCGQVRFVAWLRYWKLSRLERAVTMMMRSHNPCVCMWSVTLNSLADHSRKGSVRLSSCVNCKEGEFALARHSLTQGRQRYNMWLITSLSAIAAWSRGCAVPVHLLCSCWESLCLSCCRLLISCVSCMCNKYHHHNMNVLAKALHCSSFMHGNPSLSSL